MIISTGGSRVIKRNSNEVRRRTLIDVAKGDDGVDDSTNEVITRRRAVSEVDPVITRNIKMDDIGIRKKEKDEQKPKPAILQRDVTSKIKESVYKLPEVGFQTAWINSVSEGDVKQITGTQRQTLRKIEETNEMLRHFNLLSESTFIGLQKEYQSHVLLLGTLKTDLEQIFRRLRSLKEKIKEKYPEAVQATIETVKILRERQIMEMECEIPKYDSIDEINASADPLPAYVINPDTLDDTRSNINAHNGLSSVELEENITVAENTECNLVQRDNQKENESGEREFVVMSVKNDDLQASSIVDDTEKHNELACSDEGNIELGDLKTEIALTRKLLEDAELKEDTNSDIGHVTEKTNELQIQVESTVDKQPIGNDSKEAYSIRSSVHYNNVTDTKKLATKENIEESELEIIDDANKK